MSNQNAREPSRRAALENEEFARAVIDGQSRPQKSIPCRFFYDERGSQLFEEITRLPEYYPSRTETQILTACAGEIVQGVPAGSVLVELGSGSSAKTEILLRNLPHIAALIPIDVSKSALLAYNDPAGVTAAFNLNLLARINREIGPVFDLDAFRHEAIYNPRDGRIEMHLFSRKAQEITLLGRRYHFEVGESIHTENSYKYSLTQFQDLARSATPRRVWTDAKRLFCVHELISA